MHPPFHTSASVPLGALLGLQGPQTRQSYVTEADLTEEPDDGEAELIPDDAGKEEPSLEEVLQSEAATLAADLEALEAEGVEPELLEELGTGVESAAEALVSMREARDVSIQTSWQPGEPCQSLHEVF